MNTTLYRRKMGARERMRLWFPNINVVMIAIVRGAIAGDQVRAALAALRKKHPLLGVRVEIDPAQHGWFTTEHVPDIPVEEGTLAHLDAWMEQIETELRPD